MSETTSVPVISTVNGTRLVRSKRRWPFDIATSWKASSPLPAGPLGLVSLPMISAVSVPAPPSTFDGELVVVEGQGDEVVHGLDPWHRRAPRWIEGGAVGHSCAAAPQVARQPHVVLEGEQAPTRPAVQRHPGHARGQRRVRSGQSQHIDALDVD